MIEDGFFSFEEQLQICFEDEILWVLWEMTLVYGF